LPAKTLILTVFTALVLFITQAVNSQNLIPRFEHLGVNDGMPHSSVYSITQDKKGYMWFGTPDGLCRYDGSELRGFKYKSENANNVINNFVRGKIFADNEGNIWYSNESGIYKWDVYTENIVKVRAFTKAEFENVSFLPVALDSTGSLWLFNVVKGIFEFNIYSGSLHQYPFPVPTNTTTLLFTYNTVDNAGNIWVRLVSKNDPYLTFNKYTHVYSVHLKGDPPHAIFFSDKYIVKAFDDRLVYNDLQTGKSHTVPKMINDRKVSFYSQDGVRDNYGRLWMTARGNGLFYYDEQNNRFQKYHHNNSKIKSLPFDLTTCLYIDRSQNLWIGLDGGGVAKLDLKQPRFNLFPLSEGDYPVLNDYFTKCFYEDAKERIWFGSQTNGLNILDPKTEILLNYHYEKDNPASLPGNMVAGILKDRDGNMWIGSSGGISLFDEKSGTFKTIALHKFLKLYPDLNIFVYKMIQLKNGDLLAATMQGLVKVSRRRNGEYEGTHFSDNPFSATLTTDVVEMPDGIIYATIPGFGLYKLKPGIRGYEMSSALLNGIDLRSVRIDEKNAAWLWVSTGIGLIHLNTATEKYKLWNEKDGLANSYVYGSLEDVDGNRWISTNGGLSYLNTKTGRAENYSYLDGLQSNEFNTQAFYKSTSGNFYFGGIRGFNWFKPGYISKEVIKPVAAINRIEINGAVFQKDAGFLTNHTITLPHDKNGVNFTFAALDYTRPEANKVQYMLEGWDPNPVITKNKNARYTNLTPGNYTLKLKVSNADGIWSTEEQVIIFIQSPFWKRIWFITTMALLLLLTIVLITYNISQLKAKRRLRLLEKQVAVNAERNRISADMHDEIGSGITHIALLSELIQTQFKDATELKKDIKVIATSARRLVQTISEIIWALNPQNDTLENLLAYTREQSQQIFESLDVRFTICFPETVPYCKLSNAERRNLYLVTREALNNAMKHSGATDIYLKLLITEDKFCFTVTDNGSWIITKSVKAGHNGLSNMKKRMDDIGGGIEWIQLEEGTSVNYSLPL
jgi:signal transduction histidine kinase/ligand-binding sensor domain-containing protein